MARKWVGIALAAGLAAALFGCLKAGDGFGLTEKGEPIRVDPCIRDSTLPGCRTDSCKQNPNLPGCKSGPDCSKAPKPVECLDREYFNAKLLPLFKEKCEECHNKQNGMAWGSTKLSLEALIAWDSLVNVASREMVPPKAPMLRVKPGMPDSSYLYIKVVSSQPPVGVRMPMGKAALTSAELEIIRTWITGKP